MMGVPKQPHIVKSGVFEAKKMHQFPKPLVTFPAGSFLISGWSKQLLPNKARKVRPACCNAISIVLCSETKSGAPKKDTVNPTG
jgi:hypothetical protein